MIIKNLFNISLIFFCMFFAVFAGCGKYYFKSQGELEKRKQGKDALMVSGKGIALKLMELQIEIWEAENELSKFRNCMEFIKIKTVYEKIITEINKIETESNDHKNKLNEITGQINIFTARECPYER